MTGEEGGGDVNADHQKAQKGLPEKRTYLAYIWIGEGYYTAETNRIMRRVLYFARVRQCYRQKGCYGRSNIRQRKSPNRYRHLHVLPLNVSI